MTADAATPDPRIEAAAKAIGCYSDAQWERWQHTSKGQQAHDRAVAALSAADVVDPLRVGGVPIREQDDLLLMADTADPRTVVQQLRACASDTTSEYSTSAQLARSAADVIEHLLAAAPVGGVLPSKVDPGATWSVAAPAPTTPPSGSALWDEMTTPRLSGRQSAALSQPEPPEQIVLPSNPATFEYRNTAVIPWREADHRNHPTADHYCACICEERVLAGCPEHGWQVPRERREVRTSYGEWESV